MRPYLILVYLIFLVSTIADLPGEGSGLRRPLASGLSAKASPLAAQNRFSETKDTFEAVISSIDPSIFRILGALRVLDKKKKVVTRINNLRALLPPAPDPSSFSTTQRIVLLRGLCMLSSSVIVKDPRDKRILAGVYGVPEAKISPEIQKPDEPVQSVVKKIPTRINGNNGLYVLYSDPNIHINARVENKTVEQISIRAMKEILILRDGACIRGPYARKMHETFLHIASNEIKIHTSPFRAVSHRKNTLFVITPSAIVGIRRNAKTEQLHVYLYGESNVLQGHGIMGCWSDEGYDDRNILRRKHRDWAAKWMFPHEPLNTFAVSHPLLVYRAGCRVSYLYNRPRRHLAEMFDPVQAVSPLRRVYLKGPSNNTGYGIVNRNLVIQLIPDQSYLVRYHSYQDVKEFGDQTFDVAVLKVYLLESGQLTQSRAFSLSDAKFEIQPVEIRSVFAIDQSPKAPGVKLSMNLPWEISQIPSPWISYFEKENVSIIVPSQYNVEIYKQAGMPADRVHLVPHGIPYVALSISREMEKRSQRRKNLFGCPSDHTRFLVVNGALARKGIDIVVRAYARAFSAKDKTVLRIHCAYGETQVFQQIEKLVAETRANGGPRIVYTKGVLHETDIRSMFAESHFNISPYRAEGFGLSILESMVFGTVPIVTNYGPSLEFCRDCAIFIPCRLKVCKSFPVTQRNNQYYLFNYPVAGVPYWAVSSKKKLASILAGAHDTFQKDKKKYAAMRKKCMLAAQKHDWQIHIRTFAAAVRKIAGRKS